MKPTNEFIKGYIEVGDYLVDVSSGDDIIVDSFTYDKNQVIDGFITLNEKGTVRKKFRFDEKGDKWLFPFSIDLR